MQRRKIKWKDIPGFPGYQATRGGKVGRNGVPLKPFINRGGYLQIRATGADGKDRNLSVHRAVLLAFRGAPPNSHEGRHLDCNKLNNRLFNLKWGTRLENAQDSVFLGRMPSGECHPRHKLTWEAVAEIRKRWELTNGDKNILPLLAEKFGVALTTVRNVAIEKTW